MSEPTIEVLSHDGGMRLLRTDGNRYLLGVRVGKATIELYFEPRLLNDDATFRVDVTPEGIFPPTELRLLRQEHE
jgi:hypothetical protein